MMPGLEDIIEAILRGQLEGDKYDKLTKPQKMTASQAVLDVLAPALPILEEIKAAAWDEGSEARDTYLRDVFVSDASGVFAAPKNPYKQA